MTKQYEKRKSIFEKYSKNLFRLLETSEFMLWVDLNGKKQIADFPVYICPLCLKGHVLNSIEGDNPSLTLEHAPPKGLGGSAEILTCKSCNNTSGHSMDIAIYRQLDAEPFLKANPNSSVPVKYKIDEMPIKGELKFSDQKEPVFFIDEKSNPYHFEKIIAYLNQKSGTLNFSFSTPSFKHFRKALLRIAYLQAFALFGYTFVFNESGTNIRKILNDKSEFENIHTIDHPFEDDKVGLNLIREPEDLSAYLFILSLKTENQRRNIGVVIPRAGVEGWQNYLNFKPGRNVNFVFSHLENYVGVKENPAAIFDFFNLWDTHFPNADSAS
jgi:hypothetical protein